MFEPYEPTSPNTSGNQDGYADGEKIIMRGCISSIACLTVVFILLSVLCLLASCGTTHKTEHEHTTHVINVDTMSTEAMHDGHSHSQAVDLDSIVTAVWQRTMEEFARQEQEHEITTETLTETIDSLGRVVRQSQKTTDRTLSRQEQQRIDRLEQTVTEQVSRAIQEHDSVWQDRLATYQASVRDSLDSIRDREVQRTVSSPVTFWQQARIWLGNLVLIALAVLAALWFFRKKILWHFMKR